MFAVIELSGSQHLVKKGDILTTNKLDFNINDEIKIENVLSVTDSNGNSKIGTPKLDDASVLIKILEHSKDKKVIVFKKKRRQNYRRKNGHRQSITKIEVLDIK